MGNEIYQLLRDDQFVFWSAVTVISVVGIAAPFVYSYITGMHQRKEDNKLISEMLNRGLSSEEIEKILQSRFQNEQIHQSVR